MLIIKGKIMKLSYTLFFIMLTLTSTSLILSLIITNPFQLLSCNVTCILSLGLLAASGLYAFDDYCKQKNNHLGPVGKLTKVMLSYL